MSFASDVARWASEARRNKDEIISRTFKTVATTIVNRTPIGDWTEWKREPGLSFRSVYRPGTLANSWFAGIGEPPTLTIRDPNPTAVGSMQSIEQTAAAAPGKVAYILNPAPYANSIEYGHSGQAPSGMVRVTVAEFGDIVRQEIRNVVG